jgi:hypothetical protein
VKYVLSIMPCLWKFTNPCLGLELRYDFVDVF